MFKLELQTRRNFFSATALGLTSAGIASAQTAPTTIRMPIAPRRQWDEKNGYCGECSIQQAALYFGTYVSQYVCRAIINTNQQSQLLVAVNAQKVLTALKLNSTEFNYNGYASPQFQTYFGWVKQHLKLLHPVLITAFVKGLSDPDYDHIMLATGVTASNFTTYNSTDQLYFNDCFSSQVSIRTASTLNDIRSMLINGAKYPFCIPTKICYGCAWYPRYLFEGSARQYNSGQLDRTQCHRRCFPINIDRFCKRQWSSCGKVLLSIQV